MYVSIVIMRMLPMTESQGKLPLHCASEANPGSEDTDIYVRGN